MQIETPNPQFQGYRKEFRRQLGQTYNACLAHSISTQTSYRGALLSPTRPFNWCLGGSLLCFSEDSLDPDLCGLKTNSKYFPCSFHPRSKYFQACQTHFSPPLPAGFPETPAAREPGELVLGGAPSQGRAGRELPPGLNAAQLCSSAWPRVLVQEEVCYLLVPHTLSTGALSLMSAP